MAGLRGHARVQVRSMPTGSNQCSGQLNSDRNLAISPATSLVGARVSFRSLSDCPQTSMARIAVQGNDLLLREANSLRTIVSAAAS